MKGEYEWEWENYPKVYSVYQIPLHLDIEITTKCNLQCIMCERTYYPPKAEDMTFETYRKIIDEFSEKGGYAIKLCHLGEPLLHPELSKFIKYAKFKGIIDVMLATNGMLLNTKKSKELIGARLDFIVFSVDSSLPHIYKKIRVGGDLNVVKKNIIALNTMKQLLHSKIPKIQIQGILMFKNRAEMELGTYKSYWEPYADTVEITPYCEDYYTKREPTGETDFFCEALWQRMTVRVDGRIAICCGKRSDDKVLGDISKNSLESVWLGKAFTRIRNLMKERKSHLIRPCQACSYRISRS